MPHERDPETTKLEAQVLRQRIANAKARVGDAAGHLRQAINIIADVDTSPDIHEAAVAMDRAATVLLRFLETHKGSS